MPAMEVFTTWPRSGQRSGRRPENQRKRKRNGVLAAKGFKVI